LNAKIEWIASSGTTGVARDNIRPGLRMAIFKQRLIYFRATTDECRIIRVLHARQSLESQAFPEE